MMNYELNIRVGEDSLSFSTADLSAKEKVVFEPYELNGSISIAANLREAFKTSPLLGRGYQRATVLVDAPVMLVPMDDFAKNDMEMLYDHTFKGHESDIKMSCAVPDLHIMAVFPVGKDLRTVIQDHFTEVRFLSACMPVWKRMNFRSHTGMNRKLYGYFHNKKLEMMSFAQNHLKFCNTFNAAHAHDALYYLLYVWEQLGYSQEKDELHLVGDIPDSEWLMERLHQFVQRVYVINPTTDLGDAAITQIKGMPYDLMAYYKQ